MADVISVSDTDADVVAVISVWPISPVELTVLGLNVAVVVVTATVSGPSDALAVTVTGELVVPVFTVDAAVVSTDAVSAAVLLKSVGPIVTCKVEVSPVTVCSSILVVVIGVDEIVSALIVGADVICIVSVSPAVPRVTVMLGFVNPAVNGDVAPVSSIVSAMVDETNVPVAVEVVLKDIPVVLLSVVPSVGDTSVSVIKLAVAVVSVAVVIAMEVE